MSTVPNFRKSSYSSSAGDNCIEVADNQAAAILVRDTKDRSKGTLALRPEAWSAFVAHVGQDV